jgi:DNA mismatch repair protein MutS
MTLTPWMIQYLELKEQNKDCILFFRMWDFYEMFYEDANIAHKVLWISVTSRNKNSKEVIPLAWIPYHAKEKYLWQLIRAWYKVAIAEQVSDPKLKWIVKREVVRVVTPSTLELEWENYWSNNKENIIVWIFEQSWQFWLSIINLTTNKWLCAEYNQFDDLEKELYKLWPSEIILHKRLFESKNIADIIWKKHDIWIYYFKNTKNWYKNITNHFWISTLESFWIENKHIAIEASSMLLEYLESNQKTKFNFLKKIEYLHSTNYMNLDEITIKNLDLIYNFATKSSNNWTLFWLLNETKTYNWACYLKQQILKPLISKTDINNRLDYIEEFINNKILLDKTRNELWNISNINWIINRLSLNRANARDLINLKKSLQSIMLVYELINKHWSNKLKKIINNK